MAALPLDHVTIRGFRSISAIDKVSLGAINVLIGANGSGKSNFIGAFAFLQAIVEGNLQDYVRRSGGAERILHFGSRHTSEIVLETSFSGEENQYNINLKSTNDDGLYPAREIVYFWDKKRYKRPYNELIFPVNGGREAGISDPAARRISGWVRSHLNSWRIYHVHDTSPNSPMRKSARINDNHFFRADGANLASFLFRLRETFPQEYRLIVNSVQQVTPFFGDFILAADPLNEETIRLAWTHKGSDQYFDASALSDGSLRFIALSTLFLQPARLRPSIILVDEPELGLHPYAITLLASLVRQASRGTQVILATQSTLLLDHFEPETVLVADRSDGGTKLTRLEPAKLEEWLEDYSLGQLWEKNEIGGRPGS